MNLLHILLTSTGATAWWPLLSLLLLVLINRQNRYPFYGPRPPFRQLRDLYDDYRQYEYQRYLRQAVFSKGIILLLIAFVLVIFLIKVCHL